VVVGWFDNDLVISQESIHEGKRLITGTSIDNLVNEQRRIVVSWIGFVQIAVVDAYADSTLFFFIEPNWIPIMLREWDR